MWQKAPHGKKGIKRPGTYSEIFYTYFPGGGGGGGPLLCVRAFLCLLPLPSRKKLTCMYLHLNPSFLLAFSWAVHISWVANSPCSLLQWMANSVVLVASCIYLNSLSAIGDTGRQPPPPSALMSGDLSRHNNS